MNNTRTGRVAVTSSWANLGTLLDAEADFRGMPRSFERVKFLVPDDAAGVCQVAITDNAGSAPASNASSNYIPVAGSREYQKVNLGHVWVKTGSTTDLEFDGNPV